MRDPESLSAENILYLQRTVGNRAVSQLLARHPHPEGSPDHTTPPMTSPGMIIQPKLRVGPVGDAYEQEAERVSAMVMRQSHTPAKSHNTLPNRKDEPQHSRNIALPNQGQKTAVGPIVHRTTTDSAAGLAGGTVDTGLEQSIRSGQGSGTPLSGKVRGKMEAGFGHSFDRVRVHADNKADTLSRSLNARAFTTGSDIFFRKGEYKPESNGGQKLIAHELTHVVQQGASSVQRTPHANDASMPATPRNVVGRQPLTQDISRSSSNTVQRYEDDDLEDTQFELPSVKKQIEDKMFVRHEIDPTVTNIDKGTEWEFSTVSNPNLQASNDRSIVIQNIEEEPQEFYATDNVIKNANDVLAAHDALISLQVGPSMRVRKPHKSGTGDFQTLKRAKPIALKVLEDDHLDEYEQLTDHLCIGLASSLMGLNTGNLKHRAIFQGRDEDQTGIKSVDIESDPMISKGVQSLASALGTTGTDIDKDTILETMKTGGKVSETTGKDYGSKIAKGQMTQKAKGIGINEHAVPKVGEGYGIYSTVTETDGKNKDYTKLIPKERPRIWGYHYATVVAESEDASDKVTLENYNRLGDQFDAYFDKWRSYFPSLQVEVEKAIEDVKGRTGSDRVTAIWKNHAKLAEQAGQVKSEAMQAIKTGWQKSKEAALQAWYFRMYGTEAGKGQTFHERNTSGEESFYSNALTVRVGAQEGTKYDRTTKKFASAFFNNPGDHKSVREFKDFMAEEANPAEKKIARAVGPDAKRRVFKEEFAATKARQIQLNVMKAITEAETVDADNRQGNFPPGKDAVLLKLQQMADGCTSKKGRLNATFKKTRRTRLDTARTLILEIKEKVATLFDYYAKNGV